MKEPKSEAANHDGSPALASAHGSAARGEVPEYCCHLCGVLLPAPTPESARLYHVDIKTGKRDRFDVCGNHSPNRMTEEEWADFMCEQGMPRPQAKIFAAFDYRGIKPPNA
jgi:hypothetical protein